VGYSPERKAAVLKRMLPPNTMAIRQLSQEEDAVMGLGSNLRRCELNCGIMGGVVAPGTLCGVSTGSCREARPRISLRRKGNDMDLYIGLDVSLASTAICVVSAQGKMIKETTAASEPGELVAVLRAMPGSVVGMGLEAGPLSQWLGGCQPLLLISLLESVMERCSKQRHHGVCAP